jgi:hypothetical protein
VAIIVAIPMAILQILIVGIIATAALDIWQQIYRVAFGIPITDHGLSGHAGFIAHMIQQRDQSLQEFGGRRRAAANVQIDRDHI